MHRRTFCWRASLLAAAMLASPMLAGARQMDPALESLLPATPVGEPLEVIVSFDGEGPVTAEQYQRLADLGLTGVGMRSLPIAGVMATPAQIQALMGMDDVRSVWLNHPLDYDNREATALTGVDRLRVDPNLRSRGVPFSGKGVGVLVNDSGVDGTHNDLKYPQHVKQNVLAQTNLRSFDDMLPITYQENIPNTDIAGGHGTHVAGIIGANGAQSRGEMEGVAPGAGIVGYGSGAALFILDTIGGFDYALTHQADYNIRVVSNSFGQTSDTGTAFNPDNPTNIATKALADRGVIVVFSAGNSGAGEGTITGNFKKAPWVITVAAGDKKGRLAGFSSRGEKGRGGSVVVDGETFSWEDRPTVTAPGVDIYSARASTSGPLDLLAIDDEVNEIGPAYAPYYSKKSGTSMAAPHISGVVALMLEANPSLSWREVKQILQDTATNIPGREAWEVGAGYVNTYAAVQAALGAGQFGSTVNAKRQFNANAQVSVASSVDHTINFSPVGPTGEVQFQVAPGISMVNARANVGSNTVALVLIDPNGKRYGSSISLPVLGQNIAASAPGVPGTWTLTVRGIGSVSGNNLDPAQVTNGYGAPGAVRVNLKQLRTDGYTGLNDVAGHPAQGFVEFGVSKRLLDTGTDGRFRPNDLLKKRELAEFMLMGMAVRQMDPFAGPSFGDVSATNSLFPFVEGVSARGATLRDTFHQQDRVLRSSGSQFQPTAKVSRQELAYALVQSLGLQGEARSHAGDITVAHDGKRIVIEDQAGIDPSLRGYVQYALDLNLLPARFSISQGPFDLQPTLKAHFDPATHVTRGDYAAAATRFLGAYEQ
ncbi:S8 family serine peptidase [Lysobacter sp. CAU 1642]|uniref:S8 family serine peptidase n=1 Tax=Pseudomarimonas salicorniae TaxID=2933270 RepID=A0ABT0GEG0_9GAMM|nr:S8 family serine peptidase [Lysobacter sp. CAU 1642]MCK7592931.1 S8 family serine peptidase [Lysobacter sp. CAU 1642]